MGTLSGEEIYCFLFCVPCLWDLSLKEITVATIFFPAKVGAFMEGFKAQEDNRKSHKFVKIKLYQYT